MRADEEVMRAAVLSGRAAPEVERMINSERDKFDLECDARDREMDRELKRLEARSAKLARIAELRRKVAEQEAEALGVDVRLRRVLSAVCAHYHVMPSAVVSRGREARIVVARHAACWLARRLSGVTLKMAAQLLCRRDVGTVWHAVKHIDDMIETDREFVADFSVLMKKLEGI